MKNYFKQGGHACPIISRIALLHFRDVVKIALIDFNVAIVHIIKSLERKFNDIST